MATPEELQKQINGLFSGNGEGFTVSEINALRKAFALIIEKIAEVEELIDPPYSID